jgi:methylenetetrahydrofolate reductase (NADPH)
LDAVKKIMQVKPAVAYIAGYGLSPGDISKTLDSYKEIGIKTIFVIRGDKPAGETIKIHPDSFSYASEMIDYIKQNYNFTIGCAGYPEGHAEAESIDKDIYYLKEKTDKGAEYIVTQFCYDATIYFNYVDKCRKAGITAPIIPGIMPVYTLKMTKMLTQICAASIPSPMQAKLDDAASLDAEALIDLGIDMATMQCTELLQNGVPGLHFYTMNRSRSTTQIIENLRAKGLLPA